MVFNGNSAPPQPSLIFNSVLKLAVRLGDVPHGDMNRLQQFAYVQDVRDKSVERHLWMLRAIVCLGDNLIPAAARAQVNLRTCDRGRRADEPPLTPHPAQLSTLPADADEQQQPPPTRTTSNPTATG